MVTSITNTSLSVNAVLKPFQNTTSNKKINTSGSIPTALSVRQNSNSTDCLICSNGQHNSLTAHSDSNFWQLHQEKNSIFGKELANSAVTSSNESLPLSPAMTFHLLSIFNLKKPTSLIESLLYSEASVSMFATRDSFKTYS